MVRVIRVRVRVRVGVRVSVRVPASNNDASACTQALVSKTIYWGE